MKSCGRVQVRVSPVSTSRQNWVSTPSLSPTTLPISPGTSSPPALFLRNQSLSRVHTYTDNVILAGVLVCVASSTTIFEKLSMLFHISQIGVYIHLQSPAVHTHIPNRQQHNHHIQRHHWSSSHTGDFTVGGERIPSTAGMCNPKNSMNVL